MTENQPEGRETAITDQNVVLCATMEGRVCVTRAPVRLNVYDMYWLNDYASNIGFGIFPFGNRNLWCWSNTPTVAIRTHFRAFSKNSPQDAEELGENFKFRESIVVGETDLTASDVRNLIKQLGDEFRGDRYHLISRNCNHFSSVFTRCLTGKEIPGWINRLANVSGSIPFLERVIPQEWLTPVALQNTIEETKREKAEMAEEATETAIRRSLNDSRTTIVNGHPGNGVVERSSSAYQSSSSSTSSEDGNGPGSYSPMPIKRGTTNAATTQQRRSSSPPIYRLWNQIKASIGVSAQNALVPTPPGIGGIDAR
ncbi:unnamed protein product [Caenorhabditis auriculariae]|uniref:PPPDE domain-containing protein n=1 Tax=Caenorhabditis auriculariae TaxID=2777116 RepID=A0A8S1H4A5_9PELO|nr:unnamed protein product [Caenorhabditis auriculariae]